MLENKIYSDLFKALERFLQICNCEMFMNRDSYKILNHMYKYRITISIHKHFTITNL